MHQARKHGARAANLAFCATTQCPVCVTEFYHTKRLQAHYTSGVSRKRDFLTWAQANLIPEPLDAITRIAEPSWLKGHKRVPGTKLQGPQLPTLEERVESDCLGRYAVLLTSPGPPAPPAPLQPPVALPPAHGSNEHCDVPVACADQLAAWLSALEQWYLDSDYSAQAFWSALGMPSQGVASLPPKLQCTLVELFRAQENFFDYWEDFDAITVASKELQDAVSALPAHVQRPPQPRPEVALPAHASGAAARHSGSSSSQPSWIVFAQRAAQMQSEDERASVSFQPATEPAAWPRLGHLLLRPTFYVLHLFAGRACEGDLAAQIAVATHLEAFDVCVIDIDIVRSEEQCDLRQPRIIEDLISKALAGRFLAVKTGPPVKTWLSDHQQVAQPGLCRPLRTADQLFGRRNLREHEEAQLCVANKLFFHSTLVSLAVVLSGGAMIHARPAQPSNPRHASSWHVPQIRRWQKLPCTFSRIVWQQEFGQAAREATGLLCANLASLDARLTANKLPSCQWPISQQATGTNFPKNITKAFAEAFVDRARDLHLHKAWQEPDAGFLRWATPRLRQAHGSSAAARERERKRERERERGEQKATESREAKRTTFILGGGLEKDRYRQQLTPST